MIQRFSEDINYSFENKIGDIFIEYCDIDLLIIVDFNVLIIGVFLIICISVKNII